MSNQLEISNLNLSHNKITNNNLLFIKNISENVNILDFSNNLLDDIPDEKLFLANNCNLESMNLSNNLIKILNFNNQQYH